MLKDYVIDFPEFREITFFGAGGRLIATSRAGDPTLSVPEAARVGPDGIFIAPLQLDEDSLPRTTIAVRVMPAGGEAGWVVGEISLEELWRAVDEVHVGQQGYALLMAEEQRLIAHGNPNKKRLVATAAAPGAARTPEQNFAAELLAQADDPSRRSTTYRDADDRWMLGSGALVPRLPWVVMVEQPTDEAFRLAGQLRNQLFIAIGLALLGTVILGWLWGRSFITRIFALTRATQAIAEGRMDERVTASGKDEIRQLGDAFNSMADRLVQLQEDVRKQERQAMFGKIAAGLVHDLSHPIQTIVSNSKLIVRMFDDVEYRETFKRMIERESLVIKRVLEDLRNIAQPIPLEHFPVDIDRSVSRRRRIAAAAGGGRRRHAASGARLGRGAHPGGRLRPGARVSQPAHQRDPGDGAWRSGRDRHGGDGGTRAGPRLRHGLRHRGRSARRDLRRLRDDEAARARAGPGDLEEDRRAAGRTDLGRERGGQGNDVRPRLPEDQGARPRAGRRVDYRD